MAKGGCILFLFAVAVVGQALTPSSYFSTVDQARLRAVFEAAQPYSDLQSAYYSILGLKLLEVPVPRSQETCSFIKSQVKEKDLESIFFASSASKSLDGCSLSLSGAQSFLNEAIKGDTTVLNIYYAVFALQNLGHKVDSVKVISALTSALKTDDSPLSHGYAFQVGSLLSGDLTKLHEAIEDIIAQADEVDEKYLQFEGGLHATAMVIDGAYKLASKVNKAPTLTEDKVIKFTNYFLSRKHVRQLKSATTLLSAIKTLTNNKYHIPLAVTLASSVSVSEKSPVVQIRVSNLLGGQMGKLSVVAESARHVVDEAVVMSKKPFAASTSDSSVHELNFMQAKPACGFYTLTLNVVPQKPDARLLGTTGAKVEVKVTTQIGLENVEIGVGDKDQSMAAKTTKLQHPNKAANVLEADFHQKLIMKFQLRDRTAGVPLRAHQTFVRLTNQKTKQEIIFVAEPDSTDTYKFDLDVGGSAKLFGWLSGKYTMDLIVGDAVIENPLFWTVADVKLTFPEGSAEKKVDEFRYSKKPEIKHIFRQPEKRPAAAVSNAFTVLVLVPLLLLVILWIRLGANLSNFPMSLSAIGFHIGLGAIFGLYYLYWTQLTMFTTLRYLGLLGIPTFLFGNRLLSGIAAKRK